MTGDALHLGLQLLRSDRPLRVNSQRLRVAEIIFHLLFNLRGGHHLIEQRLGLRILFWPNAMTPVNFLNRSLISYSIGERKSRAWEMGSLRRRFSMEESQQSATCDETSRHRADKQTQ